MICECVMIHSERKTKVANKSYDSSSDTYKIYIGIRYRCNKVTQKSSNLKYRKEERKISEEWANNYLNFVRDMGERPSKDHSVDRLDNNLGYCKHNCRWATAYEQSINRTITKNKSLPLGVSLRENRICFRRTINGKEVHLLECASINEALLASRLFSLLYITTKDKLLTKEIFEWCLTTENEYNQFSKYFEDSGTELL